MTGAEPADRLAAALESVLMPIARAGPRENLTTPAPEAVDLIAALTRLRTTIADLSVEMMSGIPIHGDRWLRLADIFDIAARDCRHQAPITLAEPNPPSGQP